MFAIVAPFDGFPLGRLAGGASIRGSRVETCEGRFWMTGCVSKWNWGYAGFRLSVSIYQGSILSTIC